MDLQCLTFMGRFLENGKNLTPVQITNSVDLNRTNIVNSVGIFNGINCTNSNVQGGDTRMNNVSYKYS
jgi:hypothetical protein